MKRFFKENTKFIIVIFICIIGSSLSTYATEYLFNSNEVLYDNSTSGIRSSNVQDAIDELYTAANNYSAYDSRLTALENASNAYPVGSIYISISSTNPSELFGGTWEAFGQGRTLIGMGSNGTTNYTTIGATGGSETHQHNLSNNGYAKIYVGSMLSINDFTVPNWTSNSNYSISGGNNNRYSQNWGVGLGGKTDLINNLPPYITVYMWKRTA